MSKRTIIRMLAIAATTACTVAAMAMPAGAAQARAAGPAATPGWHVFTTVGTVPGVTSAVSLTATSRTDAWSTWGVCTPCSGQNQSSVFQVDHWNGRGWRLVAIPQRLARYGSDSVGFGASGGRDAWLFDASPLPGRALHWNGSHWAVRDIPRWVVRGNLSGTFEVSVTNFGRAGMWVFSQGQESLTPTVPFAAGYFRGRWAKIRLPGVPIEVSAVSASDIWVLADPERVTNHPRPFLMHWNGRRWSTQSVPAPRTIPPNSSEFVRDLMAAGSHDVWLQRDIEQGTQGARTLYLLHWTGQAWHRVALRKATSGVDEMARDGHGGLWLVTNGPGPAFTWFFDHLTGGRWTRTQVPSAAKTTVQEVTKLAWVPGTRSEWATGGLLPTGSNVDVLGGIWKFRSS
jgi:hypothetical protein